jgi:hypothetical protein
MTCSRGQIIAIDTGAEKIKNWRRLHKEQLHN